MRRTEVVQIRVSPGLKTRLKELPDMSSYVRGLIERDLEGVPDQRAEATKEVFRDIRASKGTATEADVKALALKLSARLSTRNARLEAERQLGLK